jgi:hypothetical protein
VSGQALRSCDIPEVQENRAASPARARQRGVKPGLVARWARGHSWLLCDLDKLLNPSRLRFPYLICEMEIIFVSPCQVVGHTWPTASPSFVHGGAPRGYVL